MYKHKDKADSQEGCSLYISETHLTLFELLTPNAN